MFKIIINKITEFDIEFITYVTSDDKTKHRLSPCEIKYIKARLYVLMNEYPDFKSARQIKHKRLKGVKVKSSGFSNLSFKNKNIKKYEYQYEFGLDGQIGNKKHWTELMNSYNEFHYVKFNSVRRNYQNPLTWDVIRRDLKLAHLLLIQTHQELFRLKPIIEINMHEYYSDDELVEDDIESKVEEYNAMSIDEKVRMSVINIMDNPRTKIAVDDCARKNLENYVKEVLNVTLNANMSELLKLDVKELKPIK